MTHTPSSSVIRSLGCAVLAAYLTGCAVLPASSPTSSPTATPTLYQRLGGPSALTPVIERTLERSAADPRTARSFDGIKLKTLRDSIVQQICSLSGGGCHYEGETMARSHADLKIVASEFDAMVTILREEMDRAGIDPGAKNELLRLLAPMKRDIVRPATAHAQGSAG